MTSLYDDKTKYAIIVSGGSKWVLGVRGVLITIGGCGYLGEVVQMGT